MADSVETAAAVVPPLNLNALKGDGDVEVLEHANGNTGTTVEAEASPAADQHGDHELTAGAEENQDEKEEGGKGKGEGGTEAPLGEGENEEGSPDGEKKEQDDKRSDSVHSTDLPIPKAEDPSEEAAVAENAAGEGEATPKAGPGSVRKMPKPFSLANPSTTALQEEKRKYPLLLQKEEFYQMYSRSYRKDMDRGAPLSPRPNRSYLNTARDHADRSTTAANLGGAETVRTSVPSTSRSFSKRGGETERAATMSNHTARKKKNILEIITARKRADGAETDKFKPADHYYAACKELNLLPVASGIVRSTDSTLDLSGQHMGDEALTAIAVANAFKKAQTILLKANAVAQAGTEVLLNVLPETVTKLDLSRNREIRCIGMETVSKSLVYMASLKELILSDCQLRDRGTEVLCEALIMCRQLTTLDLSNNRISEGGGRSLGELLEQHLTIQKIDIHWNSLATDGAEAFINGMKDNGALGGELKDVDISWNSLGGLAGTRNAAAVARLLEEKRSALVHLNIAHNAFNEQCMGVIAEGLSKNNSLLGLHIAGNAGRMDTFGFVHPISGSVPPNGPPLAPNGLPLTPEEKANLPWALPEKSPKDVAAALSYRSASLHYPEKTCWVCGGWTEVCFEYTPGLSGPDCKDLFLLLDLDDMEPVPLRRKDGGKGEGFEIWRMIPEGTHLFLFQADHHLVPALDRDQVDRLMPIVALADCPAVQAELQRQLAPRPVPSDMRLVMEPLQVNVVKVEPRKEGAEICRHTRPRLVHFDAKLMEGEGEGVEERPWEFNRSVFAGYHLDTPEKLAQAVEADIRRARISPDHADAETMSPLKDLLKKNFPQLFTLYKFYAAMGKARDPFEDQSPTGGADGGADFDELSPIGNPGEGSPAQKERGARSQVLLRAAREGERASIFSVNLKAWDKFLEECDIVGDDLKQSKADSVFLSAMNSPGLTGSRGEVIDTTLMAKGCLVRFQFLEAIIRLAEEKYLKGGPADSLRRAVEMLLQVNILPRAEVLHKEFIWKQSVFYTKEVDAIFRKHMRTLHTVFMEYGEQTEGFDLNQQASPKLLALQRQMGQGAPVQMTSRVSLSLPEFVLFAANTRAITTVCPIEELGFAFTISQMTQSDELQSSRHLEMSLPEMMEAIGRLVARNAQLNMDVPLPPPPGASASSVGTTPVSESPSRSNEKNEKEKRQSAAVLKKSVSRQFSRKDTSDNNLLLAAKDDEEEDKSLHEVAQAARQDFGEALDFFLNTKLEVALSTLREQKKALQEEKSLTN